MADQRNELATAKDLPAHQRNYEEFVKLFKYMALAAFLTALVVMYLISN